MLFFTLILTNTLNKHPRKHGSFKIKENESIGDMTFLRNFRIIFETITLA
jgi:hypothetical protein